MEANLTRRERGFVWAEIAVVLAVTFGLQGISAMLSLIEAQLETGGIGNTTVSLNPTRSDVAWIDISRQLLSAVRLFAWGGLALYFLLRGPLGSAGETLTSLRLDRASLRRDWSAGVGLAALIGIPGLCLYVIARELGINAELVPSSATDTWYKLPLLVITSIGNAVAEEIVVVGFLMTRLRQLGWTPARAIGASALLRGSYHLYQGVGGGVGNVIMGVVFGYVQHRFGKLWALIIAHALIDSVAYVGYAILEPHLGWLP